MNDRHRAVDSRVTDKERSVGPAGMHDFGRNIIMGGSSGQTAIVTTPGTPLNGLSTSTATVLDSASSSSTSSSYSSNGIHNHHETPVDANIAPAAATSAVVTTGSAFMNNNNCLKRSQVIKCVSSGRGDASEDNSHVPYVTMSDGVPQIVNQKQSQHQQPVVETVNLTVSSSESPASSVVSSRSSSLSVSPNPMMLIRSTEEEDLEDSRKVEPLKINLHREPIRTVIKLGGSSEVNHTAPKITIRPIPNPVPVVSSTNEMAEEDAIPRLHIRMNHTGESVTATQEATTVPKLTIKMAQNNLPQVQSPVVPRLTIKTNSLGGRAVGMELGSPNEHLTVPKLTIKVANDQTSSGGAMSPGTGVITSSSSSGPPLDHSPVPRMTLKPSANEVASTAIPKLKVKLQRQPVPSDEDLEEEEEESERSNSDQEEAAKETQPRIPKLTIKPVVSPPKTHAQDEPQQQQEVPKLVIKSIPKVESSNNGGGDNHQVNTSSTLSNHHHHHHRIGVQEPLDVCTAGGGQGGPQSPRIILKINKNQNSIVSNTTEVNEVEDNGPKRQLPHEHVNNTPKRSRAEERIIAVIDLDEESSRSGGETSKEKNGRPSRRLMTGRGASWEGDPHDSDTNSEETSKTKAGSVASKEALQNCSRTGVEEGGSGDGMFPDDSNDVTSEAAMRLQAPADPGEGMKTPQVKRGRGRPRKTPMVGGESAKEGSAVPESGRKRGRKKKDQDADNQVPATESSSNAPSDDETNLPSPFTSTKKPRGGGRGGMRTPSGRGRGGSQRGRGSARKPFNKQQYFKQKTFEESIMNTYFEEDTRMSAADSTAATSKTAISSQNDPMDSVSQSSHLSSASQTMDSNQTSSLPAKKKPKMEVVGTMEGKMEFTVDMIAEYDWPPGVGCCPNKNRDTFMIQEQIAEYLGVKSFKRKYPDLDRRTVEMEERNYLIERGLVTEKMCDLGVTAVYAVDVLDIMHQDFHEKYEEYKKFNREKMARDISMRQKLNKAEFGLGAREKAMRSVSNWNATLNKSRKEDRRIHMDLQNFTIQVPEAKRKKMTYPTAKPSLYPVALVVGQFSEYYKPYNPLELQTYPLNTALTSPDDLMKRLLEEKMRKRKQDEDKVKATASGTVVVDEAAKSCSTASSSSEEEEEGSQDTDDESLDSSSSESDCDVHDDDVCCVCSASQFTSPNNIPEMFVKCAVCAKMAHPSCIEMSSEMAKRAFQYQWQCVDCKRCQGCQKRDNLQKMIYCQQCDRAYHIYCTKSLQSVPKGAWHCDICSICHKCGCRNPDGTNNKIPKQVAGHRRVVDWKHEYVKNEATGLKEHCGMLCVRCAATSS